MNDEYHFVQAYVEWDERHYSLLNDLLLELTSNNIKYVILKNDEGLPFENHSKDVDIVIEPSTYDLVATLIKKCYKSNGISHYKIHRFDRLRCWYGMNPDTQFAIHIDLLEGFFHKGCETIPFDMLYEHSLYNKNGIRVLDEPMANVALLMHSAICYHRIKDKYAQRIATAFRKYQNEFVSILRQFLGAVNSELIAQLIDSGDFKQIANLGKRFSHASKVRAFLHHPLTTFIGVIGFLWEKMGRMVFNFSLYNDYLSVHAPDGTGKTTFIQSLGNLLGFYYVGSASDIISLYHFRPNILPNLGAVGEKAGVMIQDKNFTVPHRAKPVGKISSFLRMTYYWLDYVIGMPLLLRKNAQFNRITIFDRYVYDFLIDPERTRLNLPYWVRQTFCNLVKRPKLVFILMAPAETINARKKELTLDEIREQLTRLNTLAVSNKRVYCLDATRETKEIAMDALKVFLDIFASKL